jgi:hypothetical protein
MPQQPLLSAEKLQREFAEEQRAVPEVLLPITPARSGALAISACVTLAGGAHTCGKGL